MKLLDPRIAAATLVLAGLAAAAPGFTLMAADPAGNNGTIKIDGETFDSLPNNEPHVGCQFQVDFYGFDTGARASVTFDGQPPSGRDRLDAWEGRISWDDASGGGSIRGLDRQVTFDLSASIGRLERQPQQGYHVELTIEATGSRGADVKHKVFWVQGCKPDPSGDL